MDYKPGTNNIPRELEDKLTEAKSWYDQRDLKMGPDALRAYEGQGADLLDEIVEIVDRTWGFQ